MTSWISPHEAMNMVYDDPAGTGRHVDFGFAVLRPKPRDGGELRKTADLGRAKLQPREPLPEELLTAADEWPVTACRHEMILAEGVPDPSSARALLEGYDQSVRTAPPKILCVVQTLRFKPDVTRRAMMHRAYLYTSAQLQPKRLSSLLVQHIPGDARSALLPHMHVLTLCLEHRASGFTHMHPMFDGDAADLHRNFEADWHAFCRTHGWAE